MPELSPNRIRIDTLDANEATIRCSCATRGTLTVMPVSTLVRIGHERALRVADSACPTCQNQEARCAP
jgi:hypothetical protein